MSMNVEVFKVGEEDKNFVYYDYQFSRLDLETKKLTLVVGRLKINKRNGDVYTIKLAPGDKGAHAKCAAWALIRAWKKGEFPSKTYWAS